MKTKLSNTGRKSLRKEPVTSLLWPDIKFLCGKMWAMMERRRGLLLGTTLVMLPLIALFLLPRDTEFLAALQLKGSPNQELRTTLKELAGEIGRWGDFASYNLLLVLILWFGGKVRRSRYLQRMAVASLLCAVFAGALANVFRFSLGRPRPRLVEKQKVEDRFYGPQIRWDYNAFPSGHTATAFGSAIPLAIAAPPIGIPALIFSGGVSWSRMFGGQHHPTDVVTAIWIAIIFGLPLGLAVRRTRKGMVYDDDLSDSQKETEVEPNKETPPTYKTA